MKANKFLKALALATSLIGIAAPALAAEGSCAASYTYHYPTAPNQFYGTDWFVTYNAKQCLGCQPYSFGTWVKGTEPSFPFLHNGNWIQASWVNISEYPSRQTYSTAYRPNFTSSTRASVWRFNAGQSAFHYYVTTARNWNGTVPANGGNNYRVNDHYSQAEINAGYFPGFWNWSQPLYKNGTTWNQHTPQIHPDPQQYAVRYVIPTAYPAITKTFSYSYSPDVNVSDAQVRADAIANTDKITAGTLARLQQYVASGSVARPYLDLKPGVTIQRSGSSFNGNQWWSVDQGAAAEECGLFAEIVKHPRIDGVYFLKYFVRSVAIQGLAPFFVNQQTAQYIAYAPYAIGPMYEAPTIRNDTVTTRWDQAITISPLSNDIVGSEPLSLKSVSNPTSGSRTISGNTVRYTPQSGFVGTISMSYVATDGTTDAGATITVNVVAPPNQAPAIRPDVAATNYRLPVTFNVLANDSDPDGRPQPLRVSTVTNPSVGSMTWNANGTVTYTPQLGYIGPVSFSYTATDGEASASATITVNVADGNRAPVAVNDNAATDNMSATTIFVVTNDTDEDGDAMHVSAVTQPSRGSVSINPGGHSVTYMPQAGVNGTFSFTYTLSDGKLTDTASVAVAVGDPQLPPATWSGQPFDYQRYCRQTQEGSNRNSTYSSQCWAYMQRYRNE